MRPFIFSALGVAGAVMALAADPKPLYQQDFSQVAPGPAPEELLVLEGQFMVKEEAGNRFLELPGAPLDTFGLLFGPSQPSGVQVNARILATRQGRKFPTFSAGLNGVQGFKVRVVPAKKAVEITKGDDINATVLASKPFEWQSGEWTSLKLQVTKQGAGFQVQAKAWQGTPEPQEWQITADFAGEAPPGRAGVWGMPFAGTAIRFDDLKVLPVE